jgi:hypothetical protein
MQGSQMMYATYALMILGLAAPLKAAAGAPAPPFTACDAVLAALFTPPRPAMGRYDVCTAGEPIEQIVASSAASPAGAAGRVHYGPIEPLDALDAFGTAGPYERATVARLYGGTRPRVARGWRQEGGVFVSVTLVSPFPDASLTRLNPGTMEIRFTVP